LEEESIENVLIEGERPSKQKPSVLPNDFSELHTVEKHRKFCFCLIMKSLYKYGRGANFCGNRFKLPSALFNENREQRRQSFFFVCFRMGKLSRNLNEKSILSFGLGKLKMLFWGN
jgi:hypothetical protein